MTTTVATDRVRHPLVARRLVVQSAESAGGRLRRIVLGGPAVAGFSALGVTDHVKLFVPARPGAAVVPPTVADGVWLDKGDPSLTYREITVRTHRPGEDLALEIVTGDHGPVSRWAAQATPGQEVVVLGPKTSVLRPLDRPRYVLAVDETGLPALRNWLDRLPPTAHVTVLAELADAGGRVELPAVASVDVTWLHRPTSPDAVGPGTQPLADAVGRLLAEHEGPADETAPTWWWAAAEATTLARIRAEARGGRRRARPLGPDRLLAPRRRPLRPQIPRPLTPRPPHPPPPISRELLSLARTAVLTAVLAREGSSQRGGAGGGGVRGGGCGGLGLRRRRRARR